VPGGVRRGQVNDEPNSGYGFIGDPPDTQAVDFYQSCKGGRRPHQQPIRPRFQVDAVVADQPRERQEPL